MNLWSLNKMTHSGFVGLRVRHLVPVFLLMLFAATTEVMAQTVGVNQIAYITEYGTTPSMRPGQTRYRILVFKNVNTTTPYTGDVMVESIIPGLLQLNNVHVVTACFGPTGPYPVGSNNYNNLATDPKTTLQDWASLNTPACSLLTPVTLIPKITNPNILSTCPGLGCPSFTVPAGHWVYVIQEIEMVKCNSSLSTEPITTFVEFTGNSFNGIDRHKNSSTIDIREDIYSLTRNIVNTGPDYQVNNLVNNSSGNCEGTTITRTLEYVLGGSGPIIDPSLDVHLGALNSQSLSLLEIDPNSVHIELSLHTDDDNTVDVTASATLFDLVNDSRNEFFESLHYKDDVNGPAPAAAAPGNGDYNPGYRNDINATVPFPSDPSFIGHRAINKIDFIPRLNKPNPAPTPSWFDPTLSEFNSDDLSLGFFTLHLSRLIVDHTPGATGLLTDQWVSDFDNNTVPYGQEYDGTHMNSGTHAASFISIYPGSKITITYKGTHIAPDNVDDDFDALKNTIPATNIERFAIRGFRACETGLVANQTKYLLNGHSVRNQMPLISNGDQTVDIMYGNDDRDPKTIDGTEDIAVFDIDDLVFGPPGNVYESLNFDHACSELEFIVDLDMGLGARCPNYLLTNSGNNNIFFSNGTSVMPPIPGCENGTFGYAGGANPNIFCIPGSSPCVGCSSAVPTDLFELKSGVSNETFTPLSIRVMPTIPGDCTAGQRWVVRFSMQRFMRKDPSDPAKRIFHLPKATITLKLKSFCPAVEGKSKVKIKAFLIPEKCDNPVVTLARSECSGLGCPYSGCDENRMLLGESGAEIQVNCPGCKVPGWSVSPGTVNMQRHPHFVGYADLDDDGKPDGGINPNLANFNNLPEESKNRVRHGDVMTYEATGIMYEGGGSLDPTKPGFTAGDLIDPAKKNPTITLDKWVYEVSSPSGWSNYFHPIVAKTGTNTKGSILDDLSQTEYDGYLPDYTSHFYFTPPGSTTPARIDIDDSHVEWVGGKLRIAYTLAELYAATTPAGSTTVTPPLSYFTKEEVKCVMNFITDVDQAMMEDSEGTRLLNVEHFMFSSDLTMAQLLGNASITAIPSNVMDDKPDYEINDAASGQTWWCEKGSGKINVVPYIQSRRLLNTSVPSSYKQRAFRNPAMTKTFEVGPDVRYMSGCRPESGERNTNYFKNEVRPPALPYKFVVYVPEPYLPEGIYLVSHCYPDPSAYSGVNTPPAGFNDPENVNVYLIDFKNQDRELPNFAGMPLGGVMNFDYGITIEKVNPMMANMPKDPSGNDLVDPNAQIAQYKISVPVTYYWDVANAGLANPPLGLLDNRYAHYLNANTSTGLTGIPLAKGDEFQVFRLSALYAMPQCTAPAGGYTENCEFYRENDPFLYYYGDYEHTTRMKTLAGGNPTLEFMPAGASTTSADYSVAPWVYIKNSTPLLCPAQVIEGSLPIINNLPFLSTQVEGINNYLVKSPFDQDFPGAVPGAESESYGKIIPRQNVMNLFHDQRTNMKATVTQSVVEQTSSVPGAYQFKFSLTDKVLEEIFAQAGGCGTLGTGQNVADLLGPGMHQAENLLHYQKGGVNSNLAAIDINNLYFYLVPTALTSMSGTDIDLSTEIEITDLSYNGSTYTFSGGIMAGESPTEPRLFDIGSLAAAGKYDDGVSKEVTVNFNFLCDDPQTIAKLASGTNANVRMPFDVHINYHNHTDKEVYKPGNFANFTAIPEARSPNGRKKLTYQEALDTRCSNDRILGYELSVPKILLETEIIVEASGCYPKLELIVHNNGSQPMTLKQVQLNGLPTGISPTLWTESFGTYSYNLGTGLSIASSTTQTFEIDLAPLSCNSVGSTFNVNAHVLASNYCATCNVSSGVGCVTAIPLNPAQANINVSIGSNFNNYAAFNPNEVCAEPLTGGEIQINWNPEVNGVDLSTKTFLQGEQYTYHFTINNGPPQTITLNATNKSTFFDHKVTLTSSSDIESMCDGNLEIKLTQVTAATDCCTTSYTLNEICKPAATTLSIDGFNTTKTSCENAENGTAEVIVSGGVIPYTYDWNTTPQQTTDEATGLPYNIAYSVLVTDGFGCTATDNVTIGAEPLPTVNITRTGDFCTDGDYTLTATVATNYSWAHDGVSLNITTNTLQIDEPGTYTVTANNGNSDCDVVVSVDLDASLFECCPDFLDFTLYQALLANPCATLLPNGEIQIHWNTQLGTSIDLKQTTSYGPGETYTFNFMVGGQTFTSTLDASNASTFFDQTYDLDDAVVTSFCDGNAVEVKLNSITANFEECEEVFTLEENNTCSLSTTPLSATISTTNASCEGQPDGTATVAALGGMPTYTFEWNTTPVQTTPTATGLSAGTYKVVVKDEFGCEMEIDAIVAADPLPELDLTYDGEGDFCLDGFLTLKATGATTYTWAHNGNALSSTNSSLQVTEPGTYTVTGYGENTKCFSTTTIKLQANLFDCCPAIFNEEYVRIGGAITTDTYWPRKVILISDVVVSGNAKLDITNCDVISGYKGHGFAIRVEEEASLEATNSTFRTCDENLNWKGIVISEKAQAHISESVLMNARVGIRVTTQNNVYVSNSQFINNRTAAYFSASGEDKTRGHSFTGNTVTIDDRIPFGKEIYGLRLDRRLTLTTPVAQNDFVLSSGNEKMVNRKFYGVYVNKAYAVVSHNTFTNVRSPYFQYDCRGGVNAFENNKIDYNQLYRTNTQEYAAISLIESYSSTTLSGNELFNPVGADFTNKVFGIYIQGSENVVVDANRIEDFNYGVLIESSSVLTVLENEMDNALFGIYATNVSNLSIVDNHLTDVAETGILITNAIPHNYMEVNNNYVEMLQGADMFKLGIYYFNDGGQQPEVITFNNNCIRNASNALYLKTSVPCMSIPEVLGNTLYNYQLYGMSIENYVGSIGSCSPSAPGGNTFSTYTNAVDVAYITDRECKGLSLEGNYPHASLLDIRSFGNSTFSASSLCGVYGSSAECGLGAGYVPTEIHWQQIIFRGVRGRGNNRNLSPEALDILDSLPPSARLNYALGLQALLAESGNTQATKTAVAKMSAQLEPEEAAWLTYYTLLIEGAYDEAQALLPHVSITPTELQERKWYESANLNALQAIDLNQSELMQLESFENSTTPQGAKARMLLNETVGDHPFVYTVPTPPLREDMRWMETTSEGTPSPMIEAYPNPARSTVRVSYRLDELDGDAMIRLKTIHGKLVDEVPVTYEVGTVTFNLEELATGVYYVLIEQADGVLQSIKVVKE